MTLVKPVETPDEFTPYGKLKTYNNNIKALEEYGLKISGEDAKGTFMQHPESNNKNSVHVFFDTTQSKGVVHMFTDKLEPLEKDCSYNTIHILERLLEVAPLEWNKEPTEEVMIESLNDILKSQIGLPPLEPVLGNFLLESAVTFFFGDGGTGKTLLATKMAEAVASGEALEPFGQPQRARPVLYINYEVTKRQLAMRYMVGATYKDFSDNLMMIPNDHTDDMCHLEGVAGVVSQFVEANPDTGLVVIDNLSYILRNGVDEVEAADLVKGLKDICTRNGIALLVITHKPKVPKNVPMEENHMAGSSKLKNLADYIVGFRDSMTNKNAALLIEFKCRHSEKIYAADNAPLFTRYKEDYLDIRFDGFVSEAEHLAAEVGKKTKNTDRENTKRHAKHILGLGYTQGIVAKMLQITPRTIHRWLEVDKTIVKPHK